MPQKYSVIKKAMIQISQQQSKAALPRHDRINSYWVNNNPSAPVMKPFLKIHKNNIPMRPIVN